MGLTLQGGWGPVLVLGGAVLSFPPLCPSCLGTDCSRGTARSKQGQRGHFLILALSAFAFTLCKWVISTGLCHAPAILGPPGCLLGWADRRMAEKDLPPCTFTHTLACLRLGGIKTASFLVCWQLGKQGVILGCRTREVQWLCSKTGMASH